MSDKIKLLFQSDFSLAKTGFARNAKAILSYLYRTGKYEIVHYCCGLNYSNPQLQATPWKSVGCLPDNKTEMDMLQNDQNSKSIHSVHKIQDFVWVKKENEASRECKYSSGGIFGSN